MKKRWISLLMAGAMFASTLFGCSAQTASEETPDSTGDGTTVSEDTRSPSC